MEDFSIKKTRQGSLKVCHPDGSFFYAPGSMEPEIQRALNDGSDELWALVRDKAAEKMAYLKAVELLGRRDHTTKELSQKLRERDFPPAAIESALAQCREKGYLDDVRAVVTWINSRSTVGKYSRLQILSKLYEKGIPREQAASLVEEHFRSDDELSAILKYIRVHRTKGKEKTVAGLLRKGFSFQSINNAYLQVESEDKES